MNDSRLKGGSNLIGTKNGSQIKVNVRETNAVDVHEITIECRTRNTKNNEPKLVRCPRRCLLGAHGPGPKSQITISRRNGGKIKGLACTKVCSPWYTRAKAMRKRTKKNIYRGEKRG